LKRLRDSSSTGVRNAGRGCPEIARALREQIDSDDVRKRSGDTPVRPRLLRDRRGLGIV